LDSPGDITAVVVEDVAEVEEGYMGDVAPAAVKVDEGATLTGEGATTGEGGCDTC